MKSLKKIFITLKAKQQIALIMVFLLFSLHTLLDAQQIEFRGTAKSAVSVGERFQLQYSINAEGTGFKGPQISDFNVLTGPNASTSSSVQIINGNVTREVSYTFTYVLSASKEGSFTIPPATINYDGN